MSTWNRLLEIPTADVARAAFVAMFALALNGCAGFMTLSLPDNTDLNSAPEHITVSIDRSDLPGLGSIRFDPTDGLTPAEAAMLAVVNNSDLNAQRLAARVSGAQAFSAGLLPDPQVSATIDHPTGIASGLVDGTNFGVSYDIMALLTYGPTVDAADAAARQADLNLLWQEWQIIQSVKQSVTSIIATIKKSELLHAMQSQFRDRYGRSRKAYETHDLSLTETGSDLALLMDIDAQASSADRDLAKQRVDINALLGLTPETTLSFVQANERTELVDLRPDMSAVAKRRPDLLALRAGYESQDAAVWRAVLAQFPSINVGFSRARDTSNVHTTGIGITINLPIFNGGRGEVAVQEATRAQLNQEYQARLNQALSDVAALQADLKLVEQERNALAANMAQLEPMTETARAAYNRRDIAAANYAPLEAALLARRLDIIELERTKQVGLIALQTILAVPDRGASAPPERQGTNP